MAKQTFTPAAFGQEINRQAQGIRGLLLNQLQQKQAGQVRQDELQQAIALARAKAEIEQEFAGGEATLASQLATIRENFPSLFPDQQLPPTLPQPSLPAQDGIEPVRPPAAPSPFVTKPSLSIDPNTGKVRLGISQATDPRFISPQQKLATATGLRKEFTASILVKDFRIIRAQAAKIDAALADTLRADVGAKNIADQILIVGFNKIIDPTSVVRESEFARTPEGLSAINRVRGFVERVVRGSVGITDDERKDISRLAKLLVNAAGEDFNREFDRFKGLAKEFDVKQSRVLGGFNRFKPLDTGGRKSQFTPRPQFTPEEIDAEIKRRGLR